jgi:hypothetical protein
MGVKGFSWERIVREIFRETKFGPELFRDECPSWAAPWPLAQRGCLDQHLGKPLRNLCRAVFLLLPRGKSTSARRSISRVLSASDQRCGTTIPLGRALRRASRDQPGRQGGNTLGFGSFRRNLLPLFGLAHGGVYPPPTLPLARCALTAPFHPYPQDQRPNAGGMVSVALSLGSPPPAVSRHRVPVEPGLSSKACGKNIAQASAVVRPSGTSKMWCAAPLVNCRKVAQERQAARACRHPAGP